MVLLFVHVYGRVINVIYVCGGENCELEISFKICFGFDCAVIGKSGSS